MSPLPAPAQPDDALVYERTPGWAEGWVRVSLERTPAGPRVVCEWHNRAVELEPTAFVLEGLTRALKAITPLELERGLARLGSVGERALERLGRPAAAAVLAA